jgi:N-methylhydantoinase A/oxoprolinase/acetone carboxylase beta subunit
MRIRIAVDTGGTFTDLVLLDETGIRVHKVRSTPEDPARAILIGIEELLGGRTADEVIHGSTVATNALLERKGARVAFLTTAGFEGILSIGRQTRSRLYALVGEKRRPLIEDGLTFGIKERIGAGGEVVEPLSDAEVSRVVERVRKAEPEAVAICLLHAYANPVHEEKLAQEIGRAGCPVSASHKILPEHREFERASTTVVNAYVGPVMSRYLTALEQGLPGPLLRVAQSGGGFISAGQARQEAVQTILSGPAGGALGALALAAASGFHQAIGFDMGGTSTDVSLLHGTLPMTTESVIGDFPVRLPMLDIHTVGAGGGSIAWVDAGGALRVGPRSAGAEPGPACYGSGDELTVADAHLLLGRLNPSYFLGGRMPLDLDRPRRLAQALSSKLNLNEMELSEGVINVANSNMERALRVVSVQRGYDPRDFALLAFGGAGGMHACDLARALDIQTVLVPQHAGVLSALGMLLADYTKHYSHTLLQPVDQIGDGELETLFEALIAAARADLSAEGFHDDKIRTERSLDLRYLGQSYEITVPFSPGYRAIFDQMHRNLYGYSSEKRAVEVVSIRVKAVGQTEKPAIPRQQIAPFARPLPVAMREVVFNGSPQLTPFFARDSLKPGMSGPGPAIIAGAQSTTVVPPDWRFTVDPVGTLVLTSKPQDTCEATT